MSDVKPCLACGGQGCSLCAPRTETPEALAAQAEAEAPEVEETGEWTLINEDATTGERFEVRARRGERTYQTRGTCNVPLSVLDALVCFGDFSPRKLQWTNDYKDLALERVVSSSGTLPEGLHEEAIGSVTMAFRGWMLLFKPFFSGKMWFRQTIAQNTPSPGSYSFTFETVSGPDGKPDGKSTKKWVMQPHPSGDKDQCLLHLEDTISSWVPVKLIVWVSKKFGENYMRNYCARFSAWREAQAHTQS